METTPATLPAGLKPVPTGNGEPELLRDSRGRAYWMDGRPVLSTECCNTPSNRADAMQRHGLADGDEFDLDLVGSIVHRMGLTIMPAFGEESAEERASINADRRDKLRAEFMTEDWYDDHDAPREERPR